MTGVRERYWATQEETSVSLAVRAASELLGSQDLGLHEVDAIYCATGSPVAITPSTAALILACLSKGEPEPPLIQVTDINSACCGYLYALQAAWDAVNYNPEAKVLVVTTETLSRRLSSSAPSTFPIFGDAVTATLVIGAANSSRMLAGVERPVLSGKGESDPSLRVPLESGQIIHMDGPRVFSGAVKYMLLGLRQALDKLGLTLRDLDLIVPHQCNQRILDAFCNRAGVPERVLFSNIALYGNTSSSSIPLCLQGVLSERVENRLVGLCAFGGGLTFGSAILRLLPKH